MIVTNKHNELQTPKTIKGHLSVKSSALAPENCKLEKQFITAQNMASHYKRILNAKSSIDARPPKSMTQSQKARDRVNREVIKNTKLNGSVVSRSSSRPQSAEVFKSVKTDDLFDSQTLNTFRDLSARSEKLNKSMSNFVNNFTHSYDTKRAKNYSVRSSIQTTDDVDENKLDRFFATRADTSSLPLKTTSMNAYNVNSDSFDKTKLTTMLNSLLNPSLKSMARLACGRNYDVLENHPNSFKQPEKEFVPRIANRKAESKLKQTGYYNPPRPRKRQGANTNGNNVSINETINENHKASNYSMVQKEPTATIELEIKNQNSNQKDHVEKMHVEHTEPTKTDVQKPLQKANSPRLKELTMKRIAERENEILYLNFIKEVTDDIISRGVCTNRVINNIFDYHMNRNKDKLTSIKMKELLESLRIDLGMNTQEEVENTKIYSSTIQKASVFDEETRVNKLRNNSTSNEKYFTLDKFGWSNDHDEPKQSRDLNISNILNTTPQKPPTHGIIKQTNSSNPTASPSLSTKPTPLVSQSNSQNSSMTDLKHFDENKNKIEIQKQHSEIIKNIDSIRKTNNESLSPPVNRSNTAAVNVERKNSVEKPKPIQKVVEDKSSVSHKDEIDAYRNRLGSGSDSMDEEDEDDDDDEVTEKSTSSRHLVANNSNPLLQTLKYDQRNTFKITNMKSHEVTEDIDDDDNFGPKSDKSLNTISNLNQSDDDDDDDDDDNDNLGFNTLGKTTKPNEIKFNKTIGKNSNNSDDDDDENTFTQSINSSIPKPTPRKSKTNVLEKDHSDDDSF